jgi:hypothetical protein
MVGQKENSAAVNAAMVRRRFRELDKAHNDTPQGAAGEPQRPT